MNTLLYAFKIIELDELRIIQLYTNEQIGIVLPSIQCKQFSTGNQTDTNNRIDSYDMGIVYINVSEQPKITWKNMGNSCMYNEKSQTKIVQIAFFFKKNENNPISCKDFVLGS